MFPFNWRPLLVFWKWLYLHPSTSNEQSDRGVYLVETVGHCGACHTRRGILGAEQIADALGGGKIEGWEAYALNAATPAPVSWTETSLALYLKQGWAPEHGTALGPMARVTDSLAQADPADVQAIAHHLASLMAQRTSKAATRAPDISEAASTGQAIYAASCRGCHDGTRPLPLGGIRLEQSSLLHAPTAADLIHVILQGLPAADGRAAAIMPGFDGAMDEADLAALVNYLRANYAHEPPWSDLKRDADGP
jgi:mono/diheme cytochrome c family protein